MELSGEVIGVDDFSEFSINRFQFKYIIVNLFRNLVHFNLLYYNQRCRMDYGLWINGFPIHIIHNLRIMDWI